MREREGKGEGMREKERERENETWREVEKDCQRDGGEKEKCK